MTDLLDHKALQEYGRAAAAGWFAHRDTPEADRQIEFWIDRVSLTLSGA